MNPRIIFTLFVWLRASLKRIVGVGVMWQKLRNRETDESMMECFNHFEVFGACDEERSPSFWHVFSNETVRNSEITEVLWVLMPGTTPAKVTISEKKDLSCCNCSTT